MAIVKSKLFALFKSRYLPFDSWPGSAQKVLRLAFHDSLRYDVGIEDTATIKKHGHYISTINESNLCQYFMP